jgi:hypothetical protein
MAHSYYHSKSSVRKFGGTVKLYLPVHSWFDATKAIRADFRHRALRHHKQGTILAKQIFGEYIKEYKEDKRMNIVGNNLVSVEQIGEQHNTEDFQCNPDASDWYSLITLQDWMEKKLPSDVIEKLLIRKFSGEIGDYQFLINFFDQFNTDDPRSKFILNHSWGIFDAESVFGVVFNRKSDGKEIPTRTVAESVLCTNFGKIPTPHEWIESITEASWMYNKALNLSKIHAIIS